MFLCCVEIGVEIEVVVDGVNWLSEVCRVGKFFLFWIVCEDGYYVGGYGIVWYFMELIDMGVRWGEVVDWGYVCLDL